jgi:hypothetical protein
VLADCGAANDGEAICEAVGRPNMHFVAVKTEEQLTFRWRNARAGDFIEAIGITPEEGAGK